MGAQFERKEYDAIFAQATAEYPDYEYCHDARAYYLLPRWNGKEGEWVKDLTASADKIGGEAGDELYAQIFWSMCLDVPSEVSAAFKANPDCWKRVEKGFNVIMKKFPDSLAPKALRATLASMAGVREVATRYFLETKGEVDLKHWGNKEDLEGFLDWTFGK